VRATTASAPHGAGQLVPGVTPSLAGGSCAVEADDPPIHTRGLVVGRDLEAGDVVLRDGVIAVCVQE
jgi:hypothetical protein